MTLCDPKQRVEGQRPVKRHPSPKSETHTHIRDTLQNGCVKLHLSQSQICIYPTRSLNVTSAMVMLALDHSLLVENCTKLQTYSFFKMITKEEVR